MQVDDIAAQWRSEEDAVRTRLDAPGVPAAHEIGRRSGMEVFEDIFTGVLPQPPIGDILGFVPIHIAPGEAVFQGRPQRRHYNTLGTVHGGWFATLLDSAVASAIHAELPAGKGFTTLELKVNILRPLNERVPLVRAEGSVIHAGRQVVTAEGRIVGPDGKLYAHATTTCFIFDVSPNSKEISHEQT